jgi:hypothetical protein
VVYAKGIRDEPKGRRAEILAKLGTMPDGSSRHVVAIDEKQFRAMCGNIQMLVAQDGQKLLAMSTRAFRAFGGNSKTGDLGPILGPLAANMNAKIVHAPIGVIEKAGGGSMCCLCQEGKHTLVEAGPQSAPGFMPPESAPPEQQVASLV